MTKINIEAIDLFCGAGGLTKGLENSGINVKLGIDIDPYCEFAYTNNNKAEFLLKSITDTKKKDIEQYFSSNSIKILAGCAPCQTFSNYNNKADSSDDRWWLLLQFSRLIKETIPELITMENVPGLMKEDVFQHFLNELESLGYNVCYKVVNCADYGLPQSRKRLVLLGSKLGDINLLSPEETNSSNETVRKAIGNLKPLNAGESDSNDYMHISSALSDINLKRIKKSKPGGTWRDWPEALRATCHNKKSGQSYPSVYGRMKWDTQAPTITTQFYGYGNGRFGHPEQNRALSLREGAILQGFPIDYKFIENKTDFVRRKLGMLIGNAVPVKLGEVIGKSIKKHLENRNA